MCSHDRCHRGKKTDQLDDEYEMLLKLDNEIMLSVRHDSDAGSQHDYDGSVVKVAGNRRYRLETASSAKSSSCRLMGWTVSTKSNNCDRSSKRRSCQGSASTVSGRCRRCPRIHSMNATSKC